MKKCLWCLKEDGQTTFIKEAHIIPQKLGSKELCESECDECNEYFGQRESPKKPSIDICIKEALILSKYQEVGSLLSMQIKYGRKIAKEKFGISISKNVIQTLNRDTEFFKLQISETKRIIKPKRLFKYHQINPATLTNRLKRGLMKIGIEKYHKSDMLPKEYGTFYTDFYNYIRDYVRYNKGNPKIYYLIRKLGAVVMTVETVTKPRVLLHDIEENYLKFEILGHTFAFSLGNLNLTEHKFLNNYVCDTLFKPVEISTFMDIDIFNRVFRK